VASKLFDQINDVWAGKNITTKTKPDSVYMTNRFLSLDPDGFMQWLINGHLETSIQRN